VQPQPDQAVVHSCTSTNGPSKALRARRGESGPSSSAATLPTDAKLVAATGTRTDPATATYSPG
jgi:hypothetical protein